MIAIRAHVGDLKRTNDTPRYWQVIWDKIRKEIGNFNVEKWVRQGVVWQQGGNRLAAKLVDVNFRRWQGVQEKIAREIGKLRRRKMGEAGRGLAAGRKHAASEAM